MTTKTSSNPKPIAVALVQGYDPITKKTGLLVIRRAGVKNFNGILAFPSGYMELGETWQKSVVRELKEEIGIDASESNVKLVHVATSPLNGHLQVFGLVQGMCVNVRELLPTKEASEFLIVDENGFDTEFTTHKEACAAYFGTENT